MKYLVRIGLLLYLLLTLYTIYIISVRWNDFNLLIIFILFSSTIFLVLKNNIKDVISPKFFLSFIFYISYILPIYFLGIGYSGNFLLREVELFRDHNLMSQALWISFFAYVGILLALKLFNSTQSKILNKFSKKIFIRKLKYSHLFFVFCWFLFSAFFRTKFNLGVAGKQPTIQFAGLLQYLFYDGNFVLFSYLLFSTFRYFDLKKLFIVILLGLILVFTQVLLAWRGSIFNFILVAFSVFLMINSANKIIFKIPKLLIIMLISIIPLTIEMGDSIRSSGVVYQGPKVSNTFYDSFERISMRIQGLTRLMYVVSNNKTDYSLFNDFFFIDLYKMKTSAVNYIDENYHGISKYVSHSVGGSGVGTTYLLGGIFGVFISFFLLSYFLLRVYNGIKKSFNADFLIIVYANLLPIIMYAIAENFDLSVLKKIFSILFFSIFWGLILTKKKIALYN